MIDLIATTRSERTLILLTFGILAALFPGASCASNSSRLPQNGISNQRETKAIETPIPLQPTKENKGKRCGTEGTTTSEADEASNSFCHNLQVKLLNAAEAGELDKVREALREGANPNGAVDDRYPPLHQAASKGMTDAVRLLLDNGADVNLVADFERTPLGFAIYEGYIEVVKVLLERGADVCFISSAGTYEEIARSKSFAEIAALLKDARARKCK